MLEAVDGRRKVHPPRGSERLARVDAFEQGQFFETLTHCGREPIQDAAALRAGQRRPRTPVQRTACGLDRGIDIGCTGLGNVGDHFLSRGIHRGKPAAAGGLTPFSAD
jgi:hypothetical protein